VAPTYSRATPSLRLGPPANLADGAGQVGCRSSRNETEEEFEARKAAAEADETARCVGRSSNEYWKRNWVRRAARKSYARAIEPLGIDYGRDFVEEGLPSPEHKVTGKWVRERAANLEREQDKIVARTEELDRREMSIELDELEFAIRFKELQGKEQEIEATHQRLGERETALNEREKILERGEKALERIFDRLNSLASDLAVTLGFKASRNLSDKISELEEEARKLREPHDQSVPDDPFSVAKELREEPDTPGL
jgi:DNA repair exonuclease SbcCD ATPase subunit